MSNPSPVRSHAHFLLAIAAALVISIGLTSTAAIAGLISTPRVADKTPPPGPLAQPAAAAPHAPGRTRI